VDKELIFLYIAICEDVQVDSRSSWSFSVQKLFCLQQQWETQKTDLVSYSLAKVRFAP